MEFGLFTSSYKYLDLRKAFKDAKEFGYDFIELWGGFPFAYPLDLDDIRINEINELVKEFNIPIKVYTIEHNAYPYNYMLAYPYQMDRIYEYFKRSIDTCNKLNIESLLISVGHGKIEDKEERLKKLHIFLNEVVGYANSKNVNVLLETLTPYESNTCTSVYEINEIIKNISFNNLYGMCDVVAASENNETLIDYFNVLKDKMKHIHLCDGDNKSENHLIIGEGNYDIKSMIDYLKNIDYKGTITVELVEYYIDNPSLSFKKSMENIKRYLNA